MSCSQTGKEWINLRKKLDQQIPPAEKTFILMPNEEKVIDAEPVGIGVLIDPKRFFFKGLNLIRLGNSNQIVTENLLVENFKNVGVNTAICG
jgi:hypothetical protein